jgi:hypothetical protein
MASVSFQLNLDSTDDIIVCISPVQEKMLAPLYLNNHDDSTHCMDDYCPPHCILSTINNLIEKDKKITRL